MTEEQIKEEEKKEIVEEKKEITEEKKEESSISETP